MHVHNNNAQRLKNKSWTYVLLIKSNKVRDLIIKCFAVGCISHGTVLTSSCYKKKKKVIDFLVQVRKIKMDVIVTWILIFHPFTLTLVLFQVSGMIYVYCLQVWLKIDIGYNKCR